MVASIPQVRARHVNEGTSLPRDHLGERDKAAGALMRLPTVQVEVEASDTTVYGGLVVVLALVKRVRLPQLLNDALSLLRVYKPYSEADHVLTHTFNLYLGGSTIEDIATLQQSPAIRCLLGMPRVPDPTTAGDFLRRFDQPSLTSLDLALDQAMERAWQLLPRKVRRQRKTQTAKVDLDSHFKEVYGQQKEGADLNRKGVWSYHPLVVSLAGTQEVLRIRNRPGNSHDATGAVEDVGAVLPMLLRHFGGVLVRGDAQFYQSELMDLCHEAGQHFIFVMQSSTRRVEWAEGRDEAQWQPFVPRAARRQAEAEQKKRRKRKRRKNLRRQRALERGKRDLRLVKQWVTEWRYSPGASTHTYRVVVRRQLIEETDKTGAKQEVFRYRFAMTNLEQESATEVLDLLYERCDQENVIEQLDTGIAAFRMPCGTLRANQAWCCMARLAHNLKCWLSMLVLPADTVRWEWKRWRQAFVFVAATVVRHARRVRVRLNLSHRFHRELLAAHAQLQV
jgi:hypothetical protein